MNTVCVALKSVRANFTLLWLIKTPLTCKHWSFFAFHYTSDLRHTITKFTAIFQKIIFLLFLKSSFTMSYCTCTLHLLLYLALKTQTENYSVTIHKRWESSWDSFNFIFIFRIHVQETWTQKILISIVVLFFFVYCTYNKQFFSFWYSNCVGK